VIGPERVNISFFKRGDEGRGTGQAGRA
jgi:hypothetical protein